MAAVRSLRVSLPSDHSASDSGSDQDSDRDPREAEPMEVEEGELAPEPDPSPDPEDVSDTSRRYENKAGAFITGIDVNSKEAIEKKEKRAQRFHFQAEESAPQRNVCLDKERIKKAISGVRLEAVHMTGVDDMSTQDVFGYFREYPPAHIEWIDDTSCNVVWLDEDTCVRALVNTSRMPRPSDAGSAPAEQTDTADGQSEGSKGRRGQKSDEEEEDEEGEVEEKKEETAETETQSQDVSGAEVESLLRNELRPALKPFKGNKLMLRFATQDDKKEPGAARRSRYYMKYGNPNYGGMRGILSNSWKRRFHNRRIQRDVLKSKKPLIGDSLGHTPPYPHRHSAELVNLPEEPIKEEEEDEDEDMDSDDRVVEYRERGERERAERAYHSSSSSCSGSDSDHMDYDLELKMISTPSPKKSKKMTMYADELDTRLKSIRNRLGGAAPQRKRSPPPKVTDVRQLLEEKRQGQRRERPPQASEGKTDVRHRLGKRRRSPSPRSPSPHRDPPPEREPIRDVHRRLGVAKDRDRKTGDLWSRLGSSDDDSAPVRKAPSPHPPERRRRDVKPERTNGETKKRKEDEEQDEDSQLQRVWGAMIKKKQSSHKNVKKSRLDNLPSLQIEISRDSTTSLTTERVERERDRERGRGQKRERGRKREGSKTERETTAIPPTSPTTERVREREREREGQKREREGEGQKERERNQKERREKKREKKRKKERQPIHRRVRQLRGLEREREGGAKEKERGRERA
ncbi:hypothetical protein WMY93_007924 [Mugilogobius chulae]|uniref:Nuclear cap-binding protein subunit 3 n=1 Tax=Mugilogobius chulae TaxID=88201 RepID=A0AAW0PKY8_9GOBI